MAAGRNKENGFTRRRRESGKGRIIFGAAFRSENPVVGPIDGIKAAEELCWGFQIAIVVGDEHSFPVLGNNRL